MYIITKFTKTASNSLYKQFEINEYIKYIFTNGLRNFFTFKTIILRDPDVHKLNITLENRSLCIFETTIGSMVVLLPKDASGMYSAHTTWAQPT